MSSMAHIAAGRSILLRQQDENKTSAEQVAARKSNQLAQASMAKFQYKPTRGDTALKDINAQQVCMRVHCGVLIKSDGKMAGSFHQRNNCYFLLSYLKRCS